MANTQSMCTSFLSELMLGQHQLGTSTIVSRGSLTSPTTDTLKAALYLVSATMDAADTVYTATGEVSGAGYTAGGVVVTNATAPTSTNTSATAGVAYWTPSASITYTTVTLTTAFDTVLLYNSTQSNKAISVHTFGSQTITAGTFTLTMPSNTTSTALLRLATT
jgi:poly(3-hydroxyalkanoate) synthetase